jgi:ribosomal protein S18 acetylase RimI-like enzyme
MAGLTIRDYKPGDFPAIMDLWVATDMGRPERGDDEATVERSIAMGGQMLVMCSDNASGNIIGTSWLTFDGRRLLLHHFGIAPGYQGRGLAKLLLRETLRSVKKKGYQVKLEVHRTNHTAVHLYLRAGFEYLGDYDIYIIRDTQSLDV